MQRNGETDRFLSFGFDDTVVNEGPMKICQTFLAHDERPKYDATNVETLRESMSLFIKLCGFGIKLNRSIMTEEHEKFQTMVEQSYKNLSTQISQFTGE